MVNGRMRSLVLTVTRCWICSCVLASPAVRAQCADEDWLELERVTPPSMPTFFGQAGGASLAHQTGFLFVGTPVVKLVSILTEMGEVAIYAQDPRGPHEWTLFQTIVGTYQTFASTLAVEGDILAVGDPGFGNLGGNGRVFVYLRTGSGSWTFSKSITSSLGEHDGFGRRLALSSEVLAIGARKAILGPPVGGTFLHGRNVGGPDAWGLVKQLNTLVPSSLAMSGDVLVIGYDGDSPLVGGHARVFLRDLGGPNEWGELTVLVPIVGEAMDAFGLSVAIDGEIVVIGAPGDDEAGTDFGAAYVFERNLGGPNAFGFVAKLFASDAGPGDGLGSSVAVDGMLAAVATPLHDHGSTDVGATYLFQSDAGGPGVWGELQELLASDPPTSGSFGGGGVIVAADEGLAFVGAPGALDEVGVTTGAAYVFGPGTLARVRFRNDAAENNPRSFVATPALIGDFLRLTVDLSTTGHAMALPFGFDAPAEITLGGGQVLLCLDAGGSGEVIQVGAPLPGPLAVFDLLVPDLLSLCGLGLYTQALHFGGSFPFALSNAQDLVLGTGI